MFRTQSLNMFPHLPHGNTNNTVLNIASINFTNKFNFGMLSPRSGKNRFFSSRTPVDSFSEFHPESQYNICDDDPMREEIPINLSIFDDEKPAAAKPPIEPVVILPLKEVEPMRTEVRDRPEITLVVNLPVMHALRATRKDDGSAEEQLESEGLDGVEEAKSEHKEAAEEVPQVLNMKVTIPFIKSVIQDPLKASPPNPPTLVDSDKIRQILQQSSSTVKTMANEKKYTSYCTNFLSRVRLE
eukprot:TRINITY_DN9812_c0_g1_i4.p1 TRINITY_DN9812_c0_g1~~TRINITY_DN9812_c0_g1_i4.p1  ORF type:complete len:242 (-),score=35.18 TRINITY_DN9812_c0_g1_i4:830-1555(-)